ncbi:hypothetical protein Q0590_28285 [Rhodocytophaga aerolata]|uniref:Uncharacterized protein n=1 Tax=Rhodocytophaga aerolata TaxID=455078 RepID=A0ABT8RDP2_9BACT|nr:hypothetical protein [Rhodocytophaga aerolata]MDO1450212.1 hypothetical protein [Rhodocytophaga aerolata]
MEQALFYSNMPLRARDFHNFEKYLLANSVNTDYGVIWFPKKGIEIKTITNENNEFELRIREIAGFKKEKGIIIINSESPPLKKKIHIPENDIVHDIFITDELTKVSEENKSRLNIRVYEISKQNQDDLEVQIRQDNELYVGRFLIRKRAGNDPEIEMVQIPLIYKLSAIEEWEKQFNNTVLPIKQALKRMAKIYENDRYFLSEIIKFGERCLDLPLSELYLESESLGSREDNLHDLEAKIDAIVNSSNRKNRGWELFYTMKMTNHLAMDISENLNRGGVNLLPFMKEDFTTDIDTIHILKQFDDDHQIEFRFLTNEVIEILKRENSITINRSNSSLESIRTESTTKGNNLTLIYKIPIKKKQANTITFFFLKIGNLQYGKDYQLFYSTLYDGKSN